MHNQYDHIPKVSPNDSFAFMIPPDAPHKRPIDPAHQLDNSVSNKLMESCRVIEDEEELHHAHKNLRESKHFNQKNRLVAQDKIDKTHILNESKTEERAFSAIQEENLPNRMALDFVQKKLA